MIYKQYGSTGIKLSTIGFGGMRFENQDDAESCAELVKSAYDAGINYFDTAPGYGKSEELFGIALKEMNKTRTEKPFYISTKTAMETPDKVKKDLETSLKRMNLDYIDFYHVWCIITPDAYQRRKANGVLKEFEKLKAEGLIRNICVSTHMTGAEIGNMLKDYPFEGVLLGYSAMNFSYRDKGLDAAAQLNRGVVVMNPLGGGIIPNHPDRFDFLKTGEVDTAVEGALRFLINDPRITVALVGMGKQQHLKEAIRAVDRFKPLEKSEIEKIRDKLRDSFDELCTGCRYCDSCPEGIPIPQLMEAYNHLLLNDDVKEFIVRLQLHWGLSLEVDYAAKCTECGQCEEQCTQQLPIRDRLKHLQNVVSDYLANQKE